jgi:hypothetical protein
MDDLFLTLVSGQAHSIHKTYNPMFAITLLVLEQSVFLIFQALQSFPLDPL